jgi:hypothetical protein
VASSPAIDDSTFSITSSAASFSRAAASFSRRLILARHIEKHLAQKEHKSEKNCVITNCLKCSRGEFVFQDE